MARPQKEGLDYFPHDTDAVNDEKIEALRSLYGNDGYAFFFILLERIYRSPKQEIDVSDAETIQILARKVEVTTEKFTAMLQTALKCCCFDRKKYEEEGVLTSNGIKRRARPVLIKRELTQDKYKKKKEEMVSGEFLEQKRAEKKRKEKYSTKDLKQYIEQFESIWEKYPNKKGKQVAEQKFCKLRKKYTLEELYRAVERYATETKGKEKQYIQHGSTFFNSSYVDYLDENYQDEPQPTYGGPKHR